MTRSRSLGRSLKPLERIIRGALRGGSQLLRSILVYAAARLTPPRLMLNPSYQSLWERRGIHILPVHYYTPIPTTDELQALNWQWESELPGVDLSLDDQLRFLHESVTDFASECIFPTQPTDIPHQFHLNSGYFESFDAELLHSMIRIHQPRMIIEVGSGYSTYLSANTSVLNTQQTGLPSGVYAVDPFPNETLRRGFPGLAELIPKPIQDVDLDFLLQLDANDIFFIDSTHTVRIGNDVLHVFLEILPRLREGVLVHIHDVFLPRHYPQGWSLTLRRHWTEQYLLQAFLCFNREFEVVWSSSAMALRHPDELARVFPYWSDSYRLIPTSFRPYVPTLDGQRVWPSSFWLRRR